MRHLAIIGLLLCVLWLSACNDQDTGDGNQTSQAKSQAENAALGNADGAETVAVEPPPEIGENDAFTNTGEVRPENVSDRLVTLVTEMAGEYGFVYNEEKDVILNARGDVIGSPMDFAMRASMVLDPETHTKIAEPEVAVRIMFEDLASREQPPMDSEPAAQEPPPPPKPKIDTTNMTTQEMLIALAPEYNISYIDAKEVLTGAGFPGDGIGVGMLAAKVDLNISQSGKTGHQAREDEVRKMLSQLAAAGQQALKQGTTKTTADNTTAASSKSNKNRLNRDPDPKDLIHPTKVFGDWKSYREDHPSYKVDHNEDYFIMIQLRYHGNAVFRTHKNGEIYSDNEFPWRYDLNTGRLTLLDNAGKVIQGMTVYATESDPLLIWIQKDNSKVKTAYEKVGDAGEPVSEEELIAGLRELLGDEGVKQYMAWKREHENTGEEQ
ncbi:hypothetical protein JW859_14195 [bacterium]|nr:hypothetical protein [bacterium]